MEKDLSGGVGVGLIGGAIGAIYADSLVSLSPFKLTGSDVYNSSLNGVKSAYAAGAVSGRPETQLE